MKSKIITILIVVFVLIHIPYHPETFCEHQLDNIEDISGSRDNIDIAYEIVPEWKILEQFHVSDSKEEISKKEIILNEISEFVEYMFYISMIILFLSIIVRFHPIE